MSQLVSTRLAQNTVEKLKQLARRLGKTTSETGAILIEESLREAEFVSIEFRNSSIGRCAYMKGSNLAVWQVIMAAQKYEFNSEKIRQHFQRPLEWVLSALNYAEAYPDEIENAISDYKAVNYNTLKQILPSMELINLPPSVFEEE